MSNRALVLIAMAVLLLSAMPPEANALWVEPVPGSATDDEFMHVTYGFEKYWDSKFQPYPSKSSNREPDLAFYKGKLWILWEGLLVPNSNKDPVSYKGKLYLRSYDDWNGTPVWGEIIDVTPNAFYADHDNQKGRLIAYKDRLYIFWMTYDRNQKPQGVPTARFDIMMRTYDGNELLQLTPPEIISRQDIYTEEGLDLSPQPIVYKDKLYVVWFREDMIKETRDVLYRAYDGTTWSDINYLSPWPNNNTANWYPVPAVWTDEQNGKDRLYVLWQRTTKATKNQDVVYSYTDDGHTWGQVTPVSRKMDISMVTFDTMPFLSSYHNPKTGKNELHAIWRTYRTENTQNGLYDYDIVTKVFDGSTWGTTKELSPVEDTWDDTLPTAIEEGGRLHIFWSSKDDFTKTGKDYDIVRVIYDGESYSKPQEVSRVGDMDETFIDDAEFWNRGDDLWADAALYPNKWGDPRLFLSWWSFDYITGCCYDQPNATHPTIVLRLLEDTDHDKDGVSDSKDDCPDDPMDFKDTDGDKVCDASDWKPLDPTVWKKPINGKTDEAADPMPMFLMITVLIVAAISLLAYRGDKKRQRPSGEKNEAGASDDPPVDDDEDGSGTSEEE